MNRRDFLKTVALALSALVLPRIKEESEIVGVDPAKLETHSLTDYTEASDELIADAGVLTEEDILKFQGHRYEHVQPTFLMGYPIVWTEGTGPLEDCELKLGYVDWIPEEEVDV